LWVAVIRRDSDRQADLPPRKKRSSRRLNFVTIERMLKSLPLLALATAGLFYWFIVAVMSDNNHEWTTSEPVQILTGLGTLAGTIATLAIAANAAAYALRRSRTNR
jgi:hypothetical protein